MPRPLGTPLTLALLLILGIALSSPINQPALFLIAAIAACLLALALTWRATPNSPVPTIALLTAWTCAAAAWGALHLHTQPPDTIARYVHPDRPCLVQLRGRVDEPLLIGQPPTGPMAEFFHRPPDTTFRLSVHAIHTSDGWQPVTGTLLTRISLVDRRLHVGDTIETTGWLKPLSAPRNPGEFDPRPLWQRDDVQGRLSLGAGDDWQPSQHAASPSSALRNVPRQLARTSLLTGFAPESKQASLLDTLLLGSSARPIADVYDNFRQLGLAHLLAISGAHLMILLWFVWWIAKAVTHRPAPAGAMVLVVLLSYLLILPDRAAILRAGIMSGLYSLAYLTGWAYRWRQPAPRPLASSLPDSPPPQHRQKAPLFELWAVSVILVLLWRPTELFEPGTQLSFGVVAGLILWGAMVRHWLSRDEAHRIQQAMAPGTAPDLRQPSLFRLALDHLRRAFLDFIAASLIALIVAGPIVAYHFQIITPLALPLGLIMAPLVMATLVLGYLKMMLGLLLPGVAAWLIPAALLEQLIRAQIDLAAWAADLPATHLGAIHLPRQPSLTWTLAALILGAAVLSGRFKRRPLLITTAALLVTLWLALESFLPRTTWPAPAPGNAPGNPSLKLTALDLGPGRCLIIQSRQGFSRHTAVIDAGSRQWPSVGRRAILPALIDLGVRRIDTLILTSPTLEHLSAVIDLAQRITIREAWISPQIAADLEATPESWSSPARLVLAEMHRQGIPIKIIQPDQETTWPSVQLRVLASSPAPSTTYPDADAPLTLRLTIAGRTILLGDGWPALMTAASDVAPSPVVLAEWPRRTSSRADLADWLRLNPPPIVLRQGTPLVTESLYWQPIWSDLGITELTPHHQGAVQVTLGADGPPRWTTFLPPGHVEPDEFADLDDQDAAVPTTPPPQEGD